MIIKSARHFASKELAEAIVRELTPIIDRMKISCLNCDHFNKQNEQCKLVNKVPPPSIAAYGCEKWDEEIPF